jgi:hypothetical protein
MCGVFAHSQRERGTAPSHDGFISSGLVFLMQVSCALVIYGMDRLFTQFTLSDGVGNREMEQFFNPPRPTNMSLSFLGMRKVFI